MKKPTQITERLLTMKEVTEILNVSHDSLRRWDKSGKLIPLRTPGGQRRYKQSEIEKLLK